MEIRCELAPELPSWESKGVVREKTGTVARGCAFAGKFQISSTCSNTTATVQTPFILNADALFEEPCLADRSTQARLGVLSEVQTISCRRHPRRNQANPLADKPLAHFVR
jgi:hypothetical protein